MKKTLMEEIEELDSNLLSYYRDEKFFEAETRLDELFKKAKSPDEKDSLLVLYATHFHFTGDVKRAKEYIIKRIAESPELVDARIALTEHFHYHEDDIEKAAEAVEIALQKAILDKNLVRQVLGVRIRIAIKRKDCATIDASLSMLIKYIKPSEALDVALERDFITGIETLIGENDLLKRYKVLSKFED